MEGGRRLRPFAPTFLIFLGDALRSAAVPEDFYPNSYLLLQVRLLQDPKMPLVEGARVALWRFPPRPLAPQRRVSPLLPSQLRFVS